MKIFDFNQPGGFKVVTETLSEMQNAYLIFERVARMAGNKSIMSGCEELGNTITDGVVLIGDEVLEFKGGIKQNTVIIKEDTVTGTFENGTEKIIQKNRYATFGFSPTAFIWTDFKRVTPLNTLEDRLSRLEKIARPILEGNSPILFLKPANEIPAGYTEWTGSAGKSLVGRDDSDPDFKDLGKIGGSKTTTLQKSHLPKIRVGTGIYTNGGQLVDDNGPMDNIGTAANGSQIQTEFLGDGLAVTTLDPFRIVNYIIYTG